MTPPREWLKPPKSLLLILFLLTLVSVSALGWFGFKLLEQDRMVQAQRRQDRLEQAADRIAATLRGTLAETGERLSAWLAVPPPAGKPEDGILLVGDANAVTAYPAGRLLYYPAPANGAEAPAAGFAEGESLEFLQAQPARAAEVYRRIAASGDPATRAGALLRLARALGKLGRREESAAVYERMAAIAGVQVAGAPVDLVARFALAELLPRDNLPRDNLPRDNPLRGNRLPGNPLPGNPPRDNPLREDLLRGRWRLTRGQLEFYFGGALPEDRMAMAEAAAQAWNTPDNTNYRDSSARGQSTLWAAGHPFFAMWRNSGPRRALLIQAPRIPPVEQAVCAAVDSEGRVVYGRRDRAGHADGADRAAIRPAAESQLPWTLYVTGAPNPPGAGMPASQRFLLLGTAVMVLFLIAGTYFIARAIRREMEVSRMQSDFVSAVSHEFRSPLTSIRQLSEILELGRVPNEERRQVYYTTLVRETHRLQRLVEALLNFGRMEAGARAYRFEECEAAALIHRVAGEFEAEVAAGRHLELSGPEKACAIDADPDAFSVALRNLIDNAFKYSPAGPTVWVDWRVENARVAIQIRDRGLGITAAERKAIFRKFVRGSAAAAANVKGSGVGLAMVRHIVAAHHGEIRVESAPGTGSTFTILLPALENS